MREQAGRGALSLDQLGVLAAKSLENAASLLYEAEVLAALGPCPRAFSLVVLAAEEFGKHMMCFGAAGAEPDDSEYWKDFWKRFSSHRPKYENFISMVATWLPGDERKPFLQEFENHVRADLEGKLAGLYVDVVDDQVVAPVDEITEERISRLLGFVGQMIGTWRAGWSGFGAAEYTAMFEEGVLKGSRELLRAQRAKDYATVERFMQEATSRGWAEDGDQREPPAAPAGR